MLHPNSRTHRRGFFAILFAAFLVISIGSVPVRADPPSFPAASERYNLLIVMVNVLNKSHLSLYGYSKKTTPNLDRFAQNAYIFTNLVSPATWTIPVLHEFFRATPFGRDFFLVEDWPEWRHPGLTDYPLGRSLVEQGYAYFHEKLPDDASKPFISYIHITDLHYPYDPYQRRLGQLSAAQRRLSRRLLAGTDEIRLVNGPPDDNDLPAELSYLAFAVRHTEIPIDDAKVWSGILVSLKGSGDSPAAFLASRLPARLAKRLAGIQSAEQLSRGDKAAIVRALNDFIRRPDSPIGKILFSTRTAYNDPLLSLGDLSLPWWQDMVSYSIKTHLTGPAPFLTMRDGHLALLGPLNSRQRQLLRKIYREALEVILPALTPLHPQFHWLARPVGTHDKWRNSPGYQQELDLLKNLYDANLADVDKQFGDCLEKLRRLGVLDKTVVVFMGDHGEAFMEHNHFEHVKTRCYDEVINPPMVIRVPGRLAKPVVVDTQLRTADVLPTLVELMGLQLPAFSTAPAGISLAPVLAGAAPPDITVFSRDYLSVRSIRRSDGWKLISDAINARQELYNLKSDPHESRNVAEEFPSVTADLEERLNRFLYGD